MSLLTTAGSATACCHRAKCRVSTGRPTHPLKQGSPAVFCPVSIGGRVGSTYFWAPAPPSGQAWAWLPPRPPNVALTDVALGQLTDGHSHLAHRSRLASAPRLNLPLSDEPPRSPGPPSRPSSLSPGSPSSAHSLPCSHSYCGTSFSKSPPRRKDEAPLLSVTLQGPPPPPAGCCQSFWHQAYGE